MDGSYGDRTAGRFSGSEFFWCKEIFGMFRTGCVMLLQVGTCAMETEENSNQQQRNVRIAFSTEE